MESTAGRLKAAHAHNGLTAMSKSRENDTQVVGRASGPEWQRMPPEEYLERLVGAGCVNACMFQKYVQRSDNHTSRQPQVWRDGIHEGCSDSDA